MIEFRICEGKLDRFPELVAEVSSSQGRRHCRRRVDGDPGRQGSDQHNSHCDGCQDTDPVGNGFVASLARPGGNVTGLTTLTPELSGKQLELLKEIVPRLSRVAVLELRPTGQRTIVKRDGTCRDAFGVKLQSWTYRLRRISRAAFRAASKGRADAVLMLAGPVSYSPKTDCRPRGKEPASDDIRQARICGCRWAHDLWRENFRLGPARRCIRGQDPQRRQARRPARGAPTKFEFVINLKTAKQIGVTIPPNVLVRADRVIR